MHSIKKHTNNMHGALSSNMKSRRIQPLLPGKSSGKGTVHDVVKGTQPNVINVCHDSAKLDGSFRKVITIDVETFPREKSVKNPSHSSSKPDTGRLTWWRKSGRNLEYPDTSFDIFQVSQEKNIEIRSRNELSHSSNRRIGEKPTSLNRSVGNVEHVGNSFRIATQTKDKDSRSKNFLSRSFSNISVSRPTSFKKSMSNVGSPHNNIRIATQKKHEDSIRSQDFSRQCSNPIGGRPSSLSKSVGNVEHLDNSFRVSLLKRQEESRRKKDISHSLGTPSDARPTLLSNSMGRVEYRDNSFKVASQKKPTELRSRNYVSQSFRAQSGGQTTSVSKNLGNVQSLEKSFKLKPRELRSKKHCLQWTPNDGRLTSLSKSMGNVGYLDNSFRIAPQKKPNESRSRKDFTHSSSLPSGGRPTWLSKSMGNVDGLDNSFELAPPKKPKESRRKKDLSHSFSLPSGGRPTWLSKSMGNVDCLDNSFKLAPQKKPEESRSRNDLSHSFSTRSGGRPTWLSKSLGNAEYFDNSSKLASRDKPHELTRSMSHSFSTVRGGRPILSRKRVQNAERTCSFRMKPQSKPQGDTGSSSKTRTSYLFNIVASKKRVTERQMNDQPSHHICQEHQDFLRHHGKRETKGHCREYRKPRRVVSAARDVGTHSDLMDVKGVICKNVAGTALSHKKSQFRLSIVSDFSDAETFYEPKTENEEGQFRLSFVSDLSDTSGLSGIKNFETEKEDDISNDAHHGHGDADRQVRYTSIAAFFNMSVLKDHKKEEELLSSFMNGNPSGPQQASSSFLPIELTSVRSIPHLRNCYLKSAFLPEVSSEKSVFSADFTVTGLFLDDTSLTPNSVYQHCTYGSSIMSTKASFELPEDDSIVTFSSQKLEDDLAIGICESPLSSDYSATYNIHTKSPRHDSSKQQPSRSTSKTLLEAVVAMFKRTSSHGSECDLVTDLYNKRCGREDGVKRRYSKRFAFDFSAWEKRRE